MGHTHFTNNITAGKPISGNTRRPQDELDIAAWRCGDEIVLSTGHRMHVAGGLIACWIEA